MLQLVLTICLVAAPGTCREQAFDEPVTMWECLVQGQAFAHRWIQQHPGWRLEGFRCRSPEPAIPLEEGRSLPARSARSASSGPASIHLQTGRAARQRP